MVPSWRMGVPARVPAAHPVQRRQQKPSRQETTAPDPAHADSADTCSIELTQEPGTWWTGAMTVLPNRVLRALERFNAAYPWDHNAHYHQWILRQLPPRFGSALDIGSGSGDLARLLAARAHAVQGIDSDPAIISRAQRLTSPATPVTFTVADALTGIPAGPYDVITCVATLHHLPFTKALSIFRRHLAPGGTLVIVGLFRAQTAGDYVLGTIASPLNAATAGSRTRAAGHPARSR